MNSERSRTDGRIDFVVAKPGEAAATTLPGKLTDYRGSGPISIWVNGFNPHR